MADSVIISSSSKPQLVTTSDTVAFKWNGAPAVTKGIAISVAGDVAIKDELGNTVVIPAATLAIGMIHPIATGQIMATGTTATGLVAYF